MANDRRFTSAIWMVGHYLSHFSRFVGTAPALHYGAVPLRLQKPVSFQDGLGVFLSHSLGAHHNLLFDLLAV